jgi:hypothetical protein
MGTAGSLGTGMWISRFGLPIMPTASPPSTSLAPPDRAFCRGSGASSRARVHPIVTSTFHRHPSSVIALAMYPNRTRISR